MEYYKNQIFNNNNLNNKQGQQEMSFSEFFYNNIDMMPILDKSINKVRGFITYIITQLKKNEQKNLDKQTFYLTEKIFTFLLKNYEKLGIKFFYLLTKEQEFQTILINLFLDKIFVNQIKQLMEKIIYLFNFDFRARETDHPLSAFYIECINFGIIEKSDLKEKEIRESLTEEEEMFLETESLKNIWEKSRNEGEEKDMKNYLEDLLTKLQKDLTKLMGEDKLSESSIEYFQEKLYEITEFKNAKNINYQPKENHSFKNKNNKLENKNLDEYLNFYENEDEEDDDEETKTQEEIIADKKELRKKPLKDRTYFYKDEVIQEDEDEYIEFKNYYFPLKDKEKELKRQFCAFLNSHGGRLYIGITDDKKIKGVMTNEKISYYESKIMNLITNFRPKIEPKDYFKFYAIPIRNDKNGKIMDNKFVFKIMIKKGDSSELYYDFDNEGLYISTRQAGQCPNLKASEIHQKIIEANNMKKLQGKNIINNKNDILELNDPEPFINQKIKDNEASKENWRLPKKKVVKKKKNNNINFNNNNKINININYNFHNNTKNINIINNDNNINKNKNNNNNNNNNNLMVGLENKRSKKRKKKNSSNNNNKQFRIEISNIDKKVEEENLLSLIKGFNPIDINLFKNQNGIKNGYIDFENKEDADEFYSSCNNMAQGDKSITLKKSY